MSVLPDFDSSSVESVLSSFLKDTPLANFRLYWNVPFDSFWIDVTRLVISYRVFL